MSKNKKNNKLSFGKYLSIFLLIVSALVLVLVYFINVLPLEYFIILKKQCQLKKEQFACQHHKSESDKHVFHPTVPSVS